MPSDSNPVKGFRSLAGSAGQSDPANSDQNQREKHVPAEKSALNRSQYSVTPSKKELTQTPPLDGTSSHLSVDAPRRKHSVHPTNQRQRSPRVNSSEPTSQIGPSPDTAYTIELVGGLLGFFGLGYMYAGHSGNGTVRLLIGIACNVVVAVLASITFGVVACMVLPIYIVVAVLSAAALKRLMTDQNHLAP